MSSDLVLLFTCPVHPARPDFSCSQCYHAVDCSRMNKGWGARYQPVMSWFGPDAFIEFA